LTQLAALSAGRSGVYTLSTYQLSIAKAVIYARKVVINSTAGEQLREDPVHHHHELAEERPEPVLLHLHQLVGKSRRKDPVIQ